MNRFVAFAAMIAVALCSTFAAADVFSTYGNASGSNPTLLKSDDASASDTSGYAGLEDQITGTLLLSDITTLSADYEMTKGTFAAGSPRFTIFDSSFNAAYVYFGNPNAGGGFDDPNFGSTSLNNTGNYAGSPVLRIQSAGFGGYNSGYPYINWATLVANAGSTQVTYVTLDVDSGYAQGAANDFDQEMLANNFAVTPSVAVPVPASATSGIVLLGGLVAFRLARRRPSPIA